MYVRVGADSSPPSFGKVSNQLNSDLSAKQSTLDKGRAQGLNIDSVGAPGGTDIGVYWVRADENTGTQPTSGFYHLIVLNGFIPLQIALLYNNANHTMMVRQYVNGSWTSWADV